MPVVGPWSSHYKTDMSIWAEKIAKPTLVLLSGNQIEVNHVPGEHDSFIFPVHVIPHAVVPFDPKIEIVNFKSAVGRNISRILQFGLVIGRFVTKVSIPRLCVGVNARSCDSGWSSTAVFC
jgi:hypothetical protein